MKSARLKSSLLNDNNAGKPVGIHLEIGRRPIIAFGNSTGDREMLEYTKAGDGAPAALLVLHDDAEREYPCDPALGLPNTNAGAFTLELYNEARSTAGSSSASSATRRKSSPSNREARKGARVEASAKLQSRLEARDPAGQATKSDSFVRIAARLTTTPLPK